MISTHHEINMKSGSKSHAEIFFYFFFMNFDVYFLSGITLRVMKWYTLSINIFVNNGVRSSNVSHRVCALSAFDGAVEGRRQTTRATEIWFCGMMLGLPWVLRLYLGATVCCLPCEEPRMNGLEQGFIGLWWVWKSPFQPISHHTLGARVTSVELPADRCSLPKGGRFWLVPCRVRRTVSVA